MQESEVPNPGIWRVGILLEASFQEQLKQSPMKVIKPVDVAHEPDGSCRAIALCKQSLLNTYEYVSEYLNSSKDTGCLIGGIDQTGCKFPSVIVSPVSQEIIDYDSLYSQLQLTSNELQVFTGLPQPNVPDVLLVSQHFMQSYGFYTKEPVWYRYLSPVPLERVMLTPCSASENLVVTFDEKVVGQLYDKCRREIVIMQQDFEYVFRAKLPPTSVTASTKIEGSEPPPQASHTSPDTQEHVLTFKVLETSPALQGVITESTTIVLVPPVSDEQDVGEEGAPLYGSQLRRRRSTREEALEKGRASSAASASDFQLEDRMGSLYDGLPGSNVTDDYIIDAVAIGNYKLQSHYIVLPKDSATSHGIFHCQNVWVCATSVNSSPKVTKLEDLTLSLVNEQGQGESPRMHLAVVFAYEDEFDLEKYVPPSQLGADYETVDLTRAYIHPELLFHLYPETLSYSRKYQLHIKRCKVAIPNLREVKVAEIYHPGVPATSSVSLLQSSLRNQSLFLSIGDVLSVKTDSRKQYFRVKSLEPNVQNASCIDSNGKWDCILLSQKVPSYLPDLVPPSLLDRPSFFSDIQPPGLEDFAETLFSFFIPAFQEKSSTRPRRSPSVLISGPPGVGKRTAIKAVARRCRMNVIERNCFELNSEVVGFAEKKITVELDTASSNAPVVIILRNIHMMGKRDHTHQEPRLLAMFENYMTQVNKFNRTNSYPILVVGVSTIPGAIPARVQACFLHQLDMTPPTQTQRLAMLDSLARGYHVAPEVSADLTDLSKRTAGFVLGDLIALYSHAYELAYSDIVKHSSCHSEDLAISGVAVGAEHMERALASLHSSHSDAIGAPKIPNVKWEDVGGLGDAKREILDTIQLPLLHPELFSSGVQRSGVLLYGPPGTGKTLLAKAVATECSLNFLSVKGPELINMYVGQSEENIREVFTRARSAAPCVIFFDELDSIAPNRGRSGDSGGVMDRVVSQLLAELDGLNKSEHVFVIGASNRPDLIDPGLLRPGRFDRMVYLGISEDADSKIKILKAITRKFNLSPDVDLEVLATQCPVNLTGADLYALCSDAMLTALRKQVAELDKNHKSDEEWEGELLVMQEDFLDALEQLSPSVPQSEMERYREIRENLRS